MTIAVFKNFAVGPLAAKHIAVTGNKVLCLASNLPDFQIAVNGGNLGYFRQGLEYKPFRISPGSGDYTDVIRQLTVYNPNASELTITLAVSLGELEDTGFAWGDGNRFIYGGYSTDVAGEFSHVQILNPVDSGVLCYLDAFHNATHLRAYSEVRRYDTPCTTLESVGVSKNLSAVAGKVEIRTQNNASQLGVWISRLATIEYTTQSILLSGPFILDEGEGLLLCPHSVQKPLATTFEWRESPKSL